MKIIKRVKNKLKNFYHTVKFVADGKKDFLLIAMDYVYCKMRFRVTSDEYLKYGFYNFSNRYRKQFLLTKHKKQLRNINTRGFTSSKYIVYKRISDLYEREMLLVPQCGEDAFVEFIKRVKKVVLKPDYGSAGHGVKIYEYTNEEYARKKFATFSESKAYVCEEFISQHPAMQELGPFSVNTIRIVSILKDGEAQIISATLRMSANPKAVVDNMLNGGIGAQVDIATGIVSTRAIDYAFNEYTHHPSSGVQIIGFNIPNWDMAIERVKTAHKRLPQCMLLGWDVAITPNGVDIVEANNSPGSRIMQAMDRIPKGQKIIPLMKKNVLKQDRSDKYKFVPDYSQFLD